MVGLLGTVISMIGTFNEIQKAKGGVTDQAGAIGLALFATAMGLVTAIPLVFAHVLFKAWVAKFEVRMKGAAQKLLLLLQNAKPGGKGAPAAAPGAGAAAPGTTAPAGGGITPAAEARR
jgi:biopolymer transport protein ExbB